MPEAAPSAAWTTSTIVSSPATLPAQAPAIPSVFSQTGPLVLDRVGENPLGQMDHFRESTDPVHDSFDTATPGLDGDGSVLVGGAGNDLIIGGQGRNLMVGGFGFDRIAENQPETRTDAPTTDTNGDVSDSPVSLATRIARQEANDALWYTLIDQSGGAFDGAAGTDVLDQVFVIGETGLDLTEAES
jgi:Ca2+-binding RTX toxin-like protein